MLVMVLVGLCAGDLKFEALLSHLEFETLRSRVLSLSRMRQATLRCDIKYSNRQKTKRYR